MFLNPLIEHSPNADVVIPPRVNAVENNKSAPMRNRNIVEIETNGRMQWQKDREYGRRNYSELGVQHYQRTFSDAMHARDFSRQQQEAMIASGALNKMTSLGMPKSRRSA